MLTRRVHRPAVAVVVSLAVAMPIAFWSGPAAAATAPARAYDFNGDGHVDLAAGVSSLNVGSVSEAGGVVVLPGTKTGVSLSEQFLTQDTPGVPGAPQDRGYLGSSVASGDFDRDGYADLAVGYEPVILFGSKQGLTGARSYVLPEGPTTTGALVTADVDGDGWLDLAVGQPGAERVVVYRGGKAGFALARSTVLRGKSGSDERFGSALGAGDLDRDGIADLVVGADGPGFPDDEGFSGPGSVSACYGGSSGLRSCTQLVRDLKYAGNQSLGVANVSGDARPEIVFGVPDTFLQFGSSAAEKKKGRRGGAVEVLTLTGTGSATTAKTVELTQDSSGVRGTDEAGDQFGASVALGDLDRDGYADLVVGAPGEDVGSHEDAGRVTVVYGAAKGYRKSGGKVYDQATKGIPGKPEYRDGFGGAVALLDHDADGRVDLDVGAPGEDVGTEDGYKGAVTTLRGSGKSFTTKRSRTFTLKTLGYTQVGNEDFGRVLGR